MIYILIVTFILYFNHKFDVFIKEKENTICKQQKMIKKEDDP